MTLSLAFVIGRIFFTVRGLGELNKLCQITSLSLYGYRREFFSLFQLTSLLPATNHIILSTPPSPSLIF